MSDDKILKVSSASPVLSVAAAIAHAVYTDNSVKMRAIGAGAVNQAVKAIAVARGLAAPKGYNLAVIPSFQTIPGRDGGDAISAVVFEVFTLQN